MSVVDVTEGQEATPISLEPTKDAERAYQHLKQAGFRYLSEAVLPVSDVVATGCECAKECDDGCPCAACGRFYTPDLKLDFDRLASNSVLLECSDLCSCSAFCCSLSVLSKGIQCALELRWSPAKGFGLFAKDAIPRGTFVCSYSGEVISTVEARRRWKALQMAQECNFILVLREHATTGILKTCLDPTKKGNIARFINHSCDPNLSLTIIRRQGHWMPTAALFAARTIQVGEELAYSYGALTGNETLPCRCGADNCLKVLPSDPTV